jgi:hypothetical protein
MGAGAVDAAGLVARARIVLLAGEGLGTGEIAARVGTQADGDHLPMCVVRMFNAS